MNKACNVSIGFLPFLGGNMSEVKRGRPKGINKVYSIRCSDEEYVYIKECLKRYRDKKLSEADRIKKLEAAGQKTLKF